MEELEFEKLQMWLNAECVLLKGRFAEYYRYFLDLNSAVAADKLLDSLVADAQRAFRWLLMRLLETRMQRGCNTGPDVTSWGRDPI